MNKAYVNIFSKDPYKVLGIHHSASLEEIKTAYFSLIRENSPEKNQEAFKKIHAAYEQIRTQSKKQDTDFLLFEEGEENKEFQDTKGALYNPWEDILEIKFALALFSSDSH